MTNIFNESVSLFSILHFSFSLTAILSGVILFIAEKGSGWHQTLGRIYVCSMIIVCLSVFGTRDLTGALNLNHYLSAITLLLVLSAFACVYFKWPQKKWMKYHALMLLWSYVTLSAFGSAQLASHVPAITKIIPVVSISIPLAVVFIGWFLIRQSLHGILTKMGANRWVRES